MAEPEAPRANIGDFALTGANWPKFSDRRGRHTNHSSSQKTRLNDISYGIKIWTDLSSVLSQCTRLTDGQTSWLDHPAFNGSAVKKLTSRPAIAGNSSCSVFKLEPKYNCEKRASSIALSYGVDVDKWSFECFTSLCLYLMHYAAFRR